MMAGCCGCWEVLNVMHTPLAVISKAAVILSDDVFVDMMPVAWELLIETDQELAAAAGNSLHPSPSFTLCCWTYYSRVSIFLWVFCCSRFNVAIADFAKLSVPHMYRTWRSSISPELINVTQVLLEMVTVREGGLCFSEFDDVFIRQFIECICTS